MDIVHTRVLLAHLLDSLGHAVELASRSLMRASSTALLHVPELQLLEIRGVSRIRPGPVLSDSSRA